MHWPVQRSGDRALWLITYVLLISVAMVTLYPMVWMVFGSLKSDAEFYTNIWGPPGVAVWSNYQAAWVTAGMGRNFINSVIVTGATMALVFAFSSLAAYAFARIDFPGRTILFYCFLMSMMLPQAVLAITIFTVVSQFGLVNTRLAMILVYAGGSMPFGIFILRAYFMAIPRELEHAALIDGCTALGAFVRVVLPLARPGLATQLIFIAMGTWNEYFIGSLLVRSTELRTLPLGLIGFVQQYTNHYPQYFAALVITTLPIVALYILGQRLFISGLTTGALKG